ncbi:rRNA maturation RNase YbeY [Patescibacteria group bacterium]|nr:rRNA maturation RNase YbeY [Patescibacteria group bacterium]MBU4481079.1 rRNA maturation RNase YbeY [Patescibacteria group bacterium]
MTTKPVKEKFIIKIVAQVLKGEKRKEENLSIALVGQGRIRALNKRYRGKNRVTDVLAFGQEQPQPIFNGLGCPALIKGLWQKFPILPKSELGLGELVICLREVKKNAKRYETTFEKELTKVLIHGTLHLLGYDHEKSEQEAERMRKKEEYYLS